MAKWGLFQDNGDPQQTFEGAKINTLEPGYVVEVVDDHNMRVAIVRLREGQMVKKIEDRR